MPVRCKFKCSDVTKNEVGFYIRLYPVTTGSAENEKFFKYTPGGEIKIGTINEEAAKQFEPGKEYFIDITPA